MKKAKSYWVFHRGKQIGVIIDFEQGLIDMFRAIEIQVDEISLVEGEEMSGYVLYDTLELLEPIEVKK